MRKLFTVLSALFVFFCTMAFADFHSSITKIDHNNGILNFTTKMNFTDISQVIKVESNNPEFENAVKKYVEDNFYISVNNHHVKLLFTGCQINGQTVWVYFESHRIDNISSMSIRNTILLKEFSNQKNLVIISYNGKQKTLNLHNGKEAGEVSF